MNKKHTKLTLEKMCVELLKKWKEKIKDFEVNYQFGRCGADDMSMAHGRYEQLEECADYLEVILEVKGITYGNN